MTFLCYHCNKYSRIHWSLFPPTQKTEISVLKSNCLRIPLRWVLLWAEQAHFFKTSHIRELVDVGPPPTVAHGSEVHAPRSAGRDWRSQWFGHKPPPLQGLTAVTQNILHLGIFGDNTIISFFCAFLARWRSSKICQNCTCSILVEYWFPYKILVYSKQPCFNCPWPSPWPYRFLHCNSVKSIGWQSWGWHLTRRRFHRAASLLTSSTSWICSTCLTFRSKILEWRDKGGEWPVPKVPKLLDGFVFNKQFWQCCDFECPSVPKLMVVHVFILWPVEIVKVMRYHPRHHLQNYQNDLLLKQRKDLVLPA